MLREAREEFATALRDALHASGYPTEAMALEDPPDDVDAIVASSVAFRLANEAGEAPPAVAAELAGTIDLDDADYLESVTATGPYLNALPAPAYYADTLAAATGDGYGRLPPRGESVVVEHTSANPTGPVHVGRARNPIIGDALARLLDAAGYDVDVHYYVNDAGRQMAVFTWAYETFDEDEFLQAPARDRIEYDLVRYYRKGNAVLEGGDPEAVAAAEAEIQAIMHGLEAGDEAVYDRVSEVVDQVLGGMKACLERLPATFDEFVKETQFMRDGSTDEIAGRLKETEFARIEDEAWQLDLTDWDIEKHFVFLRSDGTSLYTTRDLAHHEWKFEHYDTAVTVLGEGHSLQAEQLRAALELLGNDTDRLDQVLYGWVNLPGGEGMSTRKGTGIMLDDLLDEAIDRARDEVESRMEQRIRTEDLTAEDIDRIAHIIGVGAVRYDIVSKQPMKAITFEWDRALDFEAQSAPYVQYVHARCCGILERIDGSIEAPTDATLEHDSEVALAEVIATFPYVVEQAAADREPHRIAAYLQDLADAYNAFYRDCPVLDAGGEVRARRLALVDASRRTVARGLGLLGVDAPDVM